MSDKENLRDQWSSISLTVNLRDRLYKLKDTKRYDNLINDLLLIIKIFNEAFKLADSENKQRMFEILKEQLDKPQLALISKIASEGEGKE